MDLNALFSQIQDVNILFLFFKAFAVIFSFLYVIYAVVILKQTQVMNATLRASSSSYIALISFIQILIGLGLVLLAIFTL